MLTIIRSPGCNFSSVLKRLVHNEVCKKCDQEIARLVAREKYLEQRLGIKGVMLKQWNCGNCTQITDNLRYRIEFLEEKMSYKQRSKREEFIVVAACAVMGTALGLNIWNFMNRD